MTDSILLYVLLFSIIVLVGQLFSKTNLPISLVLIITGIILSLIPEFPNITLNPEVVLNIFLPLLIYQISAFSSWKDIRNNIRPIALLSIGHVIFMTILVAIVIHAFIPALSWPLAFVLGAVISPPDDVAIVSIAEKIRLPHRITTILEGEAIFNDATALTIFRFALAAAFYQHFSAASAVFSATVILLCEGLYGYILGNLIGELRLRIDNSMLHIILSVLTPFFAYLPAEMLGGSGILATAITGFIIGNVYAVQFSPEFRLYSRAFWPSVAFVIQGVLFLLVGINMGVIVKSLSAISYTQLFIYSVVVIATVIIGRFIWVFGTVYYLPQIFALKNKKHVKLPPWQYPFAISWAGMRGGISLAAALAVPTLPIMINGANARDLLLFLVVCVIAVTFIIQGLTLPWLMKKLGLISFGTKEAYKEHVTELKARKKMATSVLKWLQTYRDDIKDDERLFDEVELYVREYKLLKKHLNESITEHQEDIPHNEEEEIRSEAFLLSQIITIEREILLTLWQQEKINLRTRNKLLDRLDHRIRHVTG